MYPYIDAKTLPNREIHRGIKAVSKTKLQTALEPVLRLLPKGVPLVPGACLGRYEGKHLSGVLEDFYLYYGVNFIDKRICERLREGSYLSIDATLAEIRPKKNGHTIDYMELHLVPRAQLATPKVQKPGQQYCPECGFDQRSLPEPLVIRKETIPENEEVFQLADDPGVVLANEKFVMGVRSLALTGIEFEAVEVV